MDCPSQRPVPVPPLAADKEVVLQSILISPDESLNAELTSALGTVGQVEIVRVLTSYPTLDNLLRSVRVRKPHFLFVCVEDFPTAAALLSQIDGLLPGLPVVALSRRFEPEVAPTLMHLGVREYLSAPIDLAVLGRVVDSIQQLLKRSPAPAPLLADLYTFLPAKPGVGCSTIAVSASCALADDLGARTLLIDCDLASGAIQFLLKLGDSSSIVDAMGKAGSLDEDLWSQMIGHWDKLDVLHAGELSPLLSIDLSSLRRVLALARSQYEVICADLASSLDPFSVELMRESRRIFVVTTPEVVPLHLAARRIRSLKELGLGDRVSLLLTRHSGCHQRLTDSELVRLVGLPLSFIFSNDYVGVDRAILNGRPVAQESELGQSIMNLARSLTSHSEPGEISKQRKFLQFFHVPQIKDTDEPWQS